MGASKSLWSGWTERDDRPWVSALAQATDTHSAAHAHLRKILPFIVTPASEGSHLRWGFEASKSERLQQEESFLGWLADSGEWKKLQAQWASDTEGPWSLPYFLMRAYSRFVSPTNKTSVEALSFEKELTQEILKEFDHMVSDVPEEARLVYLLHLEGLVDEEIAQLLGHTQEKVRGLIRATKDGLLGRADCDS